MSILKPNINKMKKLGIIGGLSCESSAEYYLRITRKFKLISTKHNTPEIIMVSVNTGDVINAINNNDWNEASKIMITASKQLEKMQVSSIIIPCNTLHKVADEVQRVLSVPLINIMDSVGTYIKNNSYSKVALLGTQWTMEDPFYKNYLNSNYNIEVEVPHLPYRKRLDDIIFNELCHGIIKPESKTFVKNLCYLLHSHLGCEAIILGCSEIPLLISADDITLDLIDTVEIHSNDAVNFLINKNDTKRQVA